MFENLTNQDIIILACLIGLIVVVGIICIVLTFRKDKNKDNEEENIEKAEPDINMALATSNIPEISEEAPALEEMLNDTKEEIEDVELTEVDKQVEEEQDEKNRSSIEEVLKAMNEDLEKQKYETIDKYEEEQEENAVISYQELVARKMALADEPEEKHVEEVITKTSYVEDEDGVTPVSFEKIQLTNPDSEEKSNSKFSNSEFISPVFGRLESTMEYPTLKKTVETETLVETKLDKSDLPEETDEFLNTLKEFRKNL